MKYIAVKDLPYDIFREMLKDKSISEKNKRLIEFLKETIEDTKRLNGKK